MESIGNITASVKPGTASPYGNDQYLNSYYKLIQHQQDVNNAWSAEQAQKQMDYQMWMSNTAHQRDVADLKAAGLNPVLSAGGSGASTTTGAMAERSDTNISALLSLINKSIDAQIEQSKAINNSARSYGTVSNNSSESDSGLFDIFADLMYRKFGIKGDSLKKAWNWIKDNVMGFTNADLGDLIDYRSSELNSALAEQRENDPRAQDAQRIDNFLRHFGISILENRYRDHLTEHMPAWIKRHETNYIQRRPINKPWK